jgi:putative ABC transport system ATP-binding protein
MITFTDISIVIGDKPILQHISCTIDAGDFIVIVGPNGAGKTTFFDMISGKRIPAHGTITFNGTDVTQHNEQQRASFISRLFQNPQLNGIGSMTVAQNLALSTYKGKQVSLKNGMSPFPVHLMNDLKHLNLGSKKILDTPMHRLSGGQRQLLACIMATAVPPQLFLLDEPTAALDPASATKLLQFAIRWIREHRITTILITHDPQLALTIGNKIWILENGTLSQQINKQSSPHLSPSDLIGHIDYEVL